MIDEIKLSDMNVELNENSSYCEDICSNVVNSVCIKLDDIMNKIQVDLDTTEEITMMYLERYCLELTNALYFIGDKLEGIGIKDDISESMRLERYNNSYLNNQTNNPTTNKKPTVAELTSMAQEDSRYESLINDIYSRAYKMIKFKVDAGARMVDSLKKIISKRMQEEQLSSMSIPTNATKILNEEM